MKYKYLYNIYPFICIIIKLLLSCAQNKVFSYMIQEEVKNEIATNVENIVCDFFNLPIEVVFSKNIKRDKVLARHFAIFILHRKEKLSTSYLAKRYKCSERMIHYICSSIGHYITNNKKYKNYYTCLTNFIKMRDE